MITVYSSGKLQYLKMYLNFRLVLTMNFMPILKFFEMHLYICQRNPCVFLRYVIVECEDQDTQQRDPKTHEMYLNVMRRFSQALLKVRTPNKTL